MQRHSSGFQLHGRMYGLYKGDMTGCPYITWNVLASKEEALTSCCMYKALACFVVTSKRRQGSVRHRYGSGMLGKHQLSPISRSQLHVIITKMSLSFWCRNLKPRKFESYDCLQRPVGGLWEMGLTILSGLTSGSRGVLDVNLVGSALFSHRL